MSRDPREVQIRVLGHHLTTASSQFCLATRADVGAPPPPIEFLDLIFPLLLLCVHNRSYWAFTATALHTKSG